MWEGWFLVCSGDGMSTWDGDRRLLVAEVNLERAETSCEGLRTVTSTDYWGTCYCEFLLL